MRTRVAVAGLLILCSCTAAPVDGVTTDAPSPASEDETIPTIEGLLEVDEVRPCMYKERIAPDRDAIAAQGLLAWLTGQTETNRELDLELGLDEVQLADKAEFEDAVAELSPTIDHEDEEIMKLTAWALGLSPHGVDVNVFLEGGEAGLIAGFYDQDTGTVVVRSKDETRVSPRAILTLAHEFTHAAADQAFDLPRLKPVGPIDDEALAYQSLFEGDASLVEFRFLSRFSPPAAIGKGLAAQLSMEDRLERGGTGTVPELLIDQSVFPYQWGMSFVCAVYKEKGWKGVNEMYVQPPTTTAQIMFPQRYLTGEGAEEPEPMQGPGSPWVPLADGAIGAAHLKSLFEAPGNDATKQLDRAVAKAAAWGGGHYWLWDADDERFATLGLALVEHKRYEGVLCDAMREWYETTFGDAESEDLDDESVVFTDTDQTGVIRCSGRDVRIGISPDDEVARAVVE